MENTITTTAQACFMTPAELLAHWKGHRGLTRRIIDAFPEDKLFNHSIGGMRPFGAQAHELVALAGLSIRSIVRNEEEMIPELDYMKPFTGTKADLLAIWDRTTEVLDELWPELPEERFHDITKIMGQWEMPVYACINYLIDNENHHRGQGYVYLRSLGIEPPPFWERY